MKGQDDFQRCLASRNRQRQTSRRLDTAETNDDDPMDAERDALWKDMDLEPPESAAALTSKHSGGDDISMTKAEGHDPQSSELIEDKELEFMGFTKLHRLCALPRNGPLDPRWDDVRQYLSDNLSKVDTAESELTSTQKEGFDYTPLHVACFICPPHDVVESLLQLCPESARITTAHGDSPVSLACGGFVPAGEEVIQELTKVYPEAREKTNSRNETPLIIHLKTMRNYELDPNPCLVKLLATVDVVNARDVKGRSPLNHIGRAATEAFSFCSSLIRFFSSDGESGPDFANFEKSSRIVFSLYPGRDSKTLYLRDLLQLPKNLRNVSFEFECTRKIINNIVGRGQYIALLIMDFYVQLMIVIAFTLGCSNSFASKSYTTVTIVGSVYWLLKRLISAIGSFKKEICMYHMMAVIHGIMLLVSSVYLRRNGMNLMQEGESGGWRSVLIINTVLIWVMLLGIVCHTLKGFSVFVHASVKIFKKLVDLFMVFALIFMCASTMFFISSVDSSACPVDEGSGEYEGEYCTLEESMSKVFTLFFGTLEASDFDVPGPTRATLVIFNIIVIILLLNIIIAVMSDCYADVSNSAELIFWDHRFELIQDVDAITQCITNLFSCYFKNDPKKTQIAEGQTQDVGAMKHEWFQKFINYKKSSDIPQPIMSLLFCVVVGLWFCVGLCTFGITWPRHTRRKIFAPSATDHPAEDQSELEAALDKVKEENSLLSEENRALRKMIDAIQNRSYPLGEWRDVPSYN